MIAFPHIVPLADEGIFRVWWFEPFIATLSFTFFIHFYWYHERQQGLSRNRTLVETIGFGWGPLYNSLIAYWLGIYLLQVLLLNAAKIIRLEQFVCNSLSQPKRQRRRRPDGIPHSGWDVLHLITELVIGIVVYDAIMFFAHWAMHEFPACRRWHVRHHNCYYNFDYSSSSSSSSETSSTDYSSINNNNTCREMIHQKPTTTTKQTNTTNTTSGAVESRDTLRHSLIDGSCQVLCNILAQQVSISLSSSTSKTSSSSSLLLRLPFTTLPKSTLARVLHNVIVIWMLTESHTCAPNFRFWRRWCVGVANHYRHHHHHLPRDHHYLELNQIGKRQHDGFCSAKRHPWETNQIGNRFNTMERHRRYYQQRHDRYQQFFGYLDDLRIWYVLRK